MNRAFFFFKDLAKERLNTTMREANNVDCVREGEMPLVSKAVSYPLNRPPDAFMMYGSQGGTI